jgi:hypothetical protein
VKSVTYIESEQDSYPGVAIKIPGKESLNIIFNFDGGDVFVKTCGKGDALIESAACWMSVLLYADIDGSLVR